MKKLLFSIFILLFSYCAFLNADQMTIRIATDTFPGGFVHEDGTGAYLDILREIYDDADFRLEFIYVPYARAVSMVQAKTADIYVAASNSRLKFVKTIFLNFSEHFFKTIENF